MVRADDAGTTLRRRMPRAEREVQMLEIAARAFGRRGFEAASMAGIAAEVGVSKPMLYAYFGSKHGLYHAVIDRAGVHLVESLQTLFVVTDPIERLREGTRVLLDFIARHRDSWAIVFSEDHTGGDTVAERVAHYRRQIVETVAYALAATTIDTPRPAQVDAATPYAVALIGAGESTINWWIAYRDVPVESARPMIDAIVDAMLAAYRREIG